MGIEIGATEFSEEDYRVFQARLDDNLSALSQLLARPGFGKGKASFGAELEMYIIDEQGYPLLVNEEILNDADDPLLTLELNRYNLEYNLAPHLLDAQPFLNTEKDIRRKLSKLDKVAEKYGGRIAIVGILPTLSKKNFGLQCMSDRHRYHALVNQLIDRRGSRFRIDINGRDPLQLEMNDVTLEGANTSFQVHYRVEPAYFATTYNALQLMTPLALAIAANSPTLFAHQLWQETRIPLFKQSIDVRHTDRYHSHIPPRVNFGNGWLREGAFELFSETVRTYEPLLPVCADEDPLAETENGSVPGLHELRLHQSSVWLWNRPVYDPCDGGHLRIEMRTFPAGPTAIDMLANAALLIGLTEGIREDINSLLPALPFYLAEQNFYRAAQYGLEAMLVWPRRHQSSCRESPLHEILTSLLPLARAGLQKIAISAEEIDRYMGVIEQRLHSRQTGAAWQQDSLEYYQRAGHSRTEALHLMLDRMLQIANTNQPVGEWRVHD